ncbi:hypothetical protein B0H13DRAFT_2379796 [Mycena leptocephala]|nr:hypothetical protein B0H13DRAFT_2379796 [Mycena leptocephala]
MSLNPLTWTFRGLRKGGQGAITNAGEILFFLSPTATAGVATSAIMTANVPASTLDDKTLAFRVAVCAPFSGQHTGTLYCPGGVVIRVSTLNPLFPANGMRQYAHTVVTTDFAMANYPVNVSASVGFNRDISMDDARADGGRRNLSFASITIRFRSGTIIIDESAMDLVQVLPVHRLPDHDSHLRFRWDTSNGGVDFGIIIQEIKIT